MAESDPEVKCENEEEISRALQDIRVYVRDLTDVTQVRRYKDLIKECEEDLNLKWDLNFFTYPPRKESSTFGRVHGGLYGGFCL